MKEKSTNIKIGFFKLNIGLDDIINDSVPDSNKVPIDKDTWWIKGLKEHSISDKERNNFSKVLKEYLSKNNNGPSIPQPEEDIEYLVNKTTIAIIKKCYVNGSEIIMFICSGDFNLIFRRKCLERLSGLRILLAKHEDTISGSESIKAYKSRDLSNGLRKSLENIIPTKKLEEIQYNSDTELITSIKFKTKFMDIHQTINASDMLEIKVPSFFNFDDIFEIIKQSILKPEEDLGSLWDLAKKIESIKDVKLIADLETSLREKIILNNIEDFILLDWPVELGINHSHFILKLKKNKQKITYDILENEVFSRLINLGISIDDILKLKLHSVDTYGKEEEDEYSIYDCIFFETLLMDQKYILFNGGWYRINNDFFKKIDGRYKEIPKYETIDKIDKLVIPMWKMDSKTRKYIAETEYIKELVKSNPNNGLYIIDKKLFNKGYDKIEIGDIVFAYDNAIFAIKKYVIKSAVISHLIQQVNNSLLALQHPQSVNESIGKKIGYDFSKVKTIVLMIGSQNGTGGLPNLPFFSRAALSNISWWDGSRINKKIFHIALEKIN